VTFHSHHKAPTRWLGQLRTHGARQDAARRLFVLLLIASPPTWGGRFSSPAVDAFWGRDLLPESDNGQPSLWLSLAGCDAGPIEGACLQIPALLIELEGVDPAGYEIHASLGDEEITCPAPACSVSLLQTSLDGVEVTSWAESLSDKREVMHTASVRVLPVGDDGEDGPPGWYVQVLSRQWRGGPVDACAVVWDTYLPIGGPPAWLSTPETPDQLAWDVMYHYLASRLILVGAVDVSECTDGALTEDSAPTACGAEKAMPVVRAWQNQFDDAILHSSRDAQLPAALIKGVIAQESQFWPGSIVERGEYGLGHLTEHGSDNTLLWNKDFYEAYCPSILGDTYCGRGYSQQSDYRKGLLRGSLLSSVDADCRNCAWGIDLDTAREGIELLSEALTAYCFQTGRMVSNVTREAPGRGSAYEDMWRLTLASYAAGPGCVADALKAAWRRGELISWSSVSDEFSEECSGAEDYVNGIAE